MGGKTKPPYAEAFRQQMVELVASGRRPSELAREFAVSAESVKAWVKKAGRLSNLPRGAEIFSAQRAVKAAAEKNALTSAEREELLRLRRENRQLKLEREDIAGIYRLMDRIVMNQAGASLRCRRARSGCQRAATTTGSGGCARHVPSRTKRSVRPLPKRTSRARKSTAQRNCKPSYEMPMSRVTTCAGPVLARTAWRG